jgi:hypothetical protein
MVEMIFKALEIWPPVESICKRMGRERSSVAKTSRRAMQQPHNCRVMRPRSGKTRSFPAVVNEPVDGRRIVLVSNIDLRIPPRLVQAKELPTKAMGLTQGTIRSNHGNGLFRNQEDNPNFQTNSTMNLHSGYAKRYEVADGTKE